MGLVPSITGSSAESLQHASRILPPNCDNQVPRRGPVSPQGTKSPPVKNLCSKHDKLYKFIVNPPKRGKSNLQIQAQFECSTALSPTPTDGHVAFFPASSSLRSHLLIHINVKRRRSQKGLGVASTAPLCTCPSQSAHSNHAPHRPRPQAGRRAALEAKPAQRCLRLGR